MDCLGISEASTVSEMIYDFNGMGPGILFYIYLLLLVELSSNMFQLHIIGFLRGGGDSPNHS